MKQPINIYLAAVYTNSYMPGGNRYPKLTEEEKVIVERAKGHNILESWHYVHRQRYVNYMRDNKAKVFLDSGAFSAWTMGVSMNIYKYCQWIIENQDIIRIDGNALMASVLDAIGDAQGTFENQMQMEKLGVRPLPCFHKYEDPRYLEFYVANYEYITIGGMVGTPPKELEVWLDQIWGKYLTDGAGNAKIKVHGFGLTSVPLMERYPWHSCDSSSWIQAASFGSIYLADHGPLAVSSQSPSRHLAGQHLCNKTELEREYLLKLLGSAGFTEERVGEVYESRAIYNLMGYMDLNERINKERAYQTENLQTGLF